MFLLEGIQHNCKMSLDPQSTANRMSDNATISKLSAELAAESASLVAAAVASSVDAVLSLEAALAKSSEL